MTQADAHVVVGEREGAASVEAGVRAFPQSVGGSAWRRRQRRLRSMGRFVAQSVRVALATTSHHSFDSRAGGSTVRTVDQRVSELERMLETDLVSRIAAVELVVETLQGDMSRGRSDLDSALDARLCSVSDEMNSNVAAVSEALQVDISRSCSELGSALRLTSLVLVQILVLLWKLGFPLSLVSSFPKLRTLLLSVGARLVWWPSFMFRSLTVSVSCLVCLVLFLCCNKMLTLSPACLCVLLNLKVSLT